MTSTSILRHRDIGSVILKGCGVEIGGLNSPQNLPKDCSIEYLDIEKASALKSLFTELQDQVVDPKYVGDIGKSTIMEITNKKFDFIIMNHVIEHVANPIQVMDNVLTGLNDNGLLIISAPDKNCTFDRHRPITTFEHLLSDYYRGVTDVCDEHYIDFLNYVHPEVFSNKAGFLNSLDSVRNRREHAHVWDSNTFKNYLLNIYALLSRSYKILYESDSEHNNLEYFAIIQNGDNEKIYGDIPLKILLAIYQSRRDLQQAFPGVQNNNIKRLLEWATTDGSSIDGDKHIINLYIESYKKMLNIL
jgi:SAM-dependent methyltransferase